MGDSEELEKLREIEARFLDPVTQWGLRWLAAIPHFSGESKAKEYAAILKLDGYVDRFKERLCWEGRPGNPWHRPQQNPPPARIERIVTGQWIDDTLARHVPGYGDKVKRIPLDAKYYLASGQSMAMILGWDWTQRLPYIVDRWDCENFAIRLKNVCDEVFGVNAVGIVVDWASGHGYNLVVLPDGNVWFLEPQTDGRVQIGRHPYKLEYGLILI